MDIPPIVSELAAKVGLTPMSWRIEEHSVTIVFEQGQKQTFERAAKPAKENFATMETPLPNIQTKKRKKVHYGNIDSA